jgi:signal transduction histidine kinase
MQDDAIATETVAYARELRALYRAAEQRAVRFRLLVEMGRDLANIRDTDRLLRMALVRATTFSGYDRGVMLLKGADGALFVRAALAMSGADQWPALPAQVFEQAAQALAGGQLIQFAADDEAADQGRLSRRIYLPLLPSDGQALGVLLLTDATVEHSPEADDLDALQLRVQSAQLHEEKDHLLSQLLEREQRLAELVDQLIGTQEEERRRVAYEIHDGIAQMSLGVVQQLHVLSDRYRPRAAPTRKALSRALEMAHAAVGEARRVIAGLRPTVLDDFGLAKAIQLQVKSLHDEGWDLLYEESLGDVRLPTAFETALFRICQEALHNVRNHADTGRVRVALRSSADTVTLVVQDWGRGFVPDQLPISREAGHHIGLASMQERVRLVGGQLQIESQPGQGTLITVTLPLPLAGPGDRPHA